MVKRCCGSVNSKFEYSYQTFHKIQASCNFGRHVERANSCPPTWRPIQILLRCWKKSNCHKISPLNGLALKFGMQDNFDVPCQIWYVRQF